MTAVVYYHMAAIFSFDVCNIYVEKEKILYNKLGDFFSRFMAVRSVTGEKLYLCPLQNTLNLKTEAFQLPKMADL